MPSRPLRAPRLRPLAWPQALLTLLFVAAHASAQEPTVTFSKDVAPIVYARCAACHRPNGPSFSLLSYDLVKARASLIADVTKRRYMPPWRPEAGHGEFAGD